MGREGWVGGWVGGGGGGGGMGLAGLRPRQRIARDLLCHPRPSRAPALALRPTFLQLGLLRTCEAPAVLRICIRAILQHLGQQCCLPLTGQRKQRVARQQREGVLQHQGSRGCCGHDGTVPVTQEAAVSLHMRGAGSPGGCTQGRAFAGVAMQQLPGPPGRRLAPRASAAAQPVQATSRPAAAVAPVVEGQPHMALAAALLGCRHAAPVQWGGGWRRWVQGYWRGIGGRLGWQHAVMQADDSITRACSLPAAPPWAAALPGRPLGLLSAASCRRAAASALVSRSSAGEALVDRGLPGRRRLRTGTARGLASGWPLRAGRLRAPLPSEAAGEAAGEGRQLGPCAPLSFSLPSRLLASGSIAAWGCAASSTSSQQTLAVVRCRTNLAWSGALHAGRGGGV